MNQRIKELAIEARLITVDGITRYALDDEFEQRFAELIVRECMKEAWDEIIDDEDIATETNPLIREYLLGNNQGIVDAVIRFRNHFGVKEHRGWVCPKCGVDRTQAVCPKGHTAAITGECPMTAEAQ